MALEQRFLLVRRCTLSASSRRYSVFIFRRIPLTQCSLYTDAVARKVTQQTVNLSCSFLPVDRIVLGIRTFLLYDGSKISSGFISKLFVIFCFQNENIPFVAFQTKHCESEPINFFKPQCPPKNPLARSRVPLKGYYNSECLGFSKFRLRFKIQAKLEQK